MSTVRKVAALAGVSAKTVSRVVNGDRYVSADLQERVQKAIVALDYVPHILSPSLRSSRDQVIGAAVPDIGDPFFAAVVSAVETMARGRGAAVLVTSLGEDPTAERVAVEALMNRPLTGLLIAPTSTHHAYLGLWQPRTEIVFVDRPPAELTADSVIEDDFGGATAAVQHLIRRGHRRIAFMGNGNAVVTTERRLAGYRSALTRAGIALDPMLEHIYQETGGKSGVPALQNLLKIPDPPTALFSSNSRNSAAIVPVLQAYGGGVAYISFGDFPMADALIPSVTVVDQRPVQLGQVAVQRLFDRIDHPGRRYERQQILPVRLRIRQSSEIRGPGHARRIS